MHSVLVILLFVAGAAGAADNGLVVRSSAHGVAETADRLEAALESKGMTVFTRIDHAAGAASVGQALPPTELVIFGNPKVGTPLMQCDPSVAIDLPQKMLIRETAEGAVQIAYNDPAWLARRHDLADCGAVLDRVDAALKAFAAAAAGG